MGVPANLSAKSVGVPACATAAAALGPGGSSAAFAGVIIPNPRLAICAGPDATGVGAGAVEPGIGMPTLPRVPGMPPGGEPAIGVLGASAGAGAVPGRGWGSGIAPVGGPPCDTCDVAPGSPWAGANRSVNEAGAFDGPDTGPAAGVAGWFGKLPAKNG